MLDLDVKTKAQELGDLPKQTVIYHFMTFYLARVLVKV